MTDQLRDKGKYRGISYSWHITLPSSKRVGGMIRTKKGSSQVIINQEDVTDDIMCLGVGSHNIEKRIKEYIDQNISD